MTGLRWWIAGLLFLATVINYIDRQTLSVVAPVLTKELGISNTEYSNILTAFLAPYTLMYVVFGWLCDRWGTRHALSTFMACWSAANALHAAARGAVGLGVFRFLLGMEESGNFMAAEKAISEWFPAKERGFANGLVNAAAATGAIISPPLIAWITLRFGWRAAFVVTGFLGFVWLGAWLALYRLPQSHPRISADDDSRRSRGENERAHPLPRTSTIAAGLGIAGRAYLFRSGLWWFYLFWLPKYLQDVRHLSLAEIGMIAWLPYLMADIGSLFGGWVSGRLIAAGKPVLKTRRSTMVPFALLMPVGILVATLPSTPALGVISLVTFSHMAWKTNLMTMTNDIFPTAVVGSAAGVVGLGSGLAGAISMPLVGRIVDAFGYNAVFWAMGFLHPAAMLFVFVLVRPRTVVVATAELQENQTR